MLDKKESYIKSITRLHIQVLKELVLGKNINEIFNNFSREMEYLDYKNFIINKAHRLTFKNNELIGAYPISVKKSNFLVEIEKLGSCYAMCALDAIGIAFTFNKPIQITTKDFSSGNELFIKLNPEKDVMNIPFIITYNKEYNSIKELVDTNAQLAIDACPTILFYSVEDEKIKNKSNYLEFSDAIETARDIFSPDGFERHFRETLKKS